MMSAQDELKAVYHEYDRDPAFAHFRDAGQRLVPGRGSMSPRIVLVGEAPGQRESYRRKPFVGPAGGVLDNLLSTVGLSRADVFVTNIVKYRPTIGQIQVRNRTPNPQEIDASRPYIFRELDIFQNTPVVTLGNTPLRALYRPDASNHKSRISEWHGHGWYDADRMYFAMYHPAVAVYDPDRYDELVVDMKEMAKHFLE